MDNKELAFSVKILGTDGQLSQLAKVEQQLIKLRDQRNHLNKAYKDGEISGKQLAKAQAEMNVTSKLLNTQKRELMRTIQLENTRVKNQVSTYKNLDASLQLLKRRYKELTEEERKSARGVALQKKITELDGKLKAFDSTMGQHQRNVGNYNGVLKGANGILSAFGGQLSSNLTRVQMLTSSVVQMTAATDASTAATTRGAKAMKFFRLAMAPVILILSAIVGLFVASTKRGAEFAKELSGLRAILGGLADDESMAKLSEQARDLGKSTQYTAIQVVSLQTELAKLGFTVEEILNSTGGILNLATALDVSLADAADLAGSTLRAFGYDSAQMSRVVDVLAVSASTSALNFERLQESLKLAIPSAKAFGLSLEDTVSLLGVLADRGIRGSLAGTGLQRVLIDLNAAGLSLQEGFDLVQGSTDKLGTAMELVGDRGGKTLLTLSENVGDIERLGVALNDSADGAERMAEVRLDNLAGDTTRLKSAWDGLLLTIEDGEGTLNSIARSVVQFFTNAVDSVSSGLDNAKENFSLLWDVILIRLGGAKERFEGRFQILGGIVERWSLLAQKAISQVPIIGRAIDIDEVNRNLEAVNLSIQSGLRKLNNQAEVERQVDARVRLRHERVEQKDRKREQNRAQKELAAQEKQNELDKQKELERIRREGGKKEVKEVKEVVEEIVDTRKMDLEELKNLQKLAELAIRAQVLREEMTVEQGEKKLLEIRKEFLQQRLDLIDTETTEGKVKYQELVNEILEINKQLLPKEQGGGATEETKGFLQSLLSISDEDAELLKNKAITLAQDIATSISNIQAIERQNRLNAELDAEELANERNQKQLDDRLEKGLITQEQYTARKSQLDAEYENKREQIEREAFERNKKAAIANAVIAGGLAVINVLATNKGGAIARLIETAYVVAQTGLQIAEIKAQEFAQGGVVLSGQRVPESSRNIPTKRNGDNVLATVRTGEVVLNQSQQMALGGDRTFAAIGVPGFASGGRITPTAPIINGTSGGSMVRLDAEQLRGLFDHMNMLVDTKIRNLRVSESDITSTQTTVATLEQEATF